MILGVLLKAQLLGRKILIFGPHTCRMFLFSKPAWFLKGNVLWLLCYTWAEGSLSAVEVTIVTRLSSESVPHTTSTLLRVSTFLGTTKGSACTPNFCRVPTLSSFGETLLLVFCLFVHQEFASFLKGIALFLVFLTTGVEVVVAISLHSQLVLT